MKQAEFIRILNRYCSDIFQTEQLLKALKWDSNSSESVAVLRKCMHNHLYRLEQKQLIKRLSPKGSPNGQFEKLFSQESTTKVLTKRPEGTSNKHINNTSTLTSHYNALQKHIKQLKHQFDAFKSLSDKFESCRAIINPKLKKLDAELYKKSIELNAVNELINEVKKRQLI
ncbi:MULTISPECIES: hypothetical protein [unclassified Shewanella]|uniref:hypothetical protein n=1 Tax=unclassified Shewanella TaxID=196818 RepID=UPI000C821340|nr:MULTISPECIES: hypothetical protein [unclassified Shewanella]MDO6639355.1 hypothetical protein [Shewanella sp. 5_MG-2023]MDO6680580.1 hypothetical protein [Shewanella sp. 4_MG-2023]MDO6774815.1 hypothetical protein [Shewanella sp. 3_MG-2023]PMI02106.1 hypothetical protein BCU55_08005 [Shewanella sp. 10N.286.48.A6]